MNLLDGLEVIYNMDDNIPKRGIVIQTSIKNFSFLIAILTEDGSIIVEPSRCVIFQEKDLKRLRKKAPEIAKKLSRFEIMDI